MLERAKRRSPNADRKRQRHRSALRRTRGRATSRAIVFVNSLGTDFRIWDGVIAALDGRFRTIRYDKRGHGLSDAPPAPYRMDDHVGDLEALLAMLGVGKAVFVGLSVGGMIVTQLASRHPQKVAGLVLCDTAHKIGTDELWNERIAAVEKRAASPQSGTW